MKQSLRFQRCIQRIGSRVEGRRKGIACDLKDKSVMSLNGVVQNFIVPRKQSRHVIRILLRKFRTAFNIRKEKSNCTGRNNYGAS